MSLYWDASYEIVLALSERYPDVDVETVGLEQLYQMIITLLTFEDDPAYVSDDVLADILVEWYEEVSS
jgi:FeS assembly protein IscX